MGVIGGVSLVAARPEADLVGFTSINPVSDDRWSNVALHAEGRALVTAASHGEKPPNGNPSGGAVEEITTP